VPSADRKRQQTKKKFACAQQVRAIRVASRPQNGRAIPRSEFKIAPLPAHDTTHRRDTLALRLQTCALHTPLAFARQCVLCLIAVIGVCAPAAAADAPRSLRVPILLYHRLGPTVADSMTITLEHFDEQLRILHAKDWHVIRLSELMAALRDPQHALPARSVVLTADDGHLSVYTQMLPRMRRERLPVTLFIYPSAIGHASYAMTWAQLQALQATGLFDIQSHTYWHPNFKVERKRLAADAFKAFLDTQFRRARNTLQQHGAGTVDLLAWPFGIHDDELARAARAAGYVAAFTIDARPVTRTDDAMALPRYLITDADHGKRFERLLDAAVAQTSVRPR
jgi:peptidoglycan/xylan/chitin deacetylase (PgdA/CDA1 family)